MDREAKLKEYLCNEENKGLLEPVIDEFIFLEEKLTYLKTLPFIQVNKNNPGKQRATPAAKQYKELLQQYTNILKVLQRYDKNNENQEESPLRKWVNQHIK